MMMIIINVLAAYKIHRDRIAMSKIIISCELLEPAPQCSQPIATRGATIETVKNAQNYDKH